MSLILPKTCSIGGGNTGLVSTIGVTLLNPNGTTHTARATADIYEIGGGCYGKEITFEDNWKGVILWDSGGVSPVYAVEEYDIEGLVDTILEDTLALVATLSDIKGTGFVKDTHSLPQCLTATGFSVHGPGDILANVTKKVPADLEDVPTGEELNTDHGLGSWKTGSNSGRGGSVIASPWLPREKDKIIKDIEELLSGQELLRELLQELQVVSNAILDSQGKHVEKLSGLITSIEVENPKVDLSEVKDMLLDLQVELEGHVSIDQFRSLSNKIAQLERYVLRLLDNKDLEEELG